MADVAPDYTADEYQAIRECHAWGKRAGLNVNEWCGFGRWYVARYPALNFPIRDALVIWSAIEAGRL